ncbi:MAG: hypothetical protein WCS83_03990 [Endomicrobiia bacterium]|nr:hypothetical protein [Endomicrobiaceae bacterium]MDD3922814.1 hypothetical protein [Endomicrobiaceae bacterium]MDD5102534.1 hypothetical protein [Endomicrobiaceae bacterium]
MKIINLKPVKSSIKVFNFLEKKSLIKTIKPTTKTLSTRTKTGAVDILYTSKKTFGSHRLMCIGKRTQKVQLCYHLDNEDFMFLNPLNIDFQKLFLVFALDKFDVFSKKLSQNNLKHSDFIALEIIYNDPNLSFFTMLKKTVHCEIIQNEDKQHPVFFVTESSELKNNKIVHKNIQFIIDGEK